MAAASVSTSEAGTRRSIAAIEACDVTRDFSGKIVLDKVSLRVPQGAVHALLGPNGAGKTTLLRILAGIIHPSSGSARVMGIESTRNERSVRRYIGLVPPGNRSFYFRISGLENLVFFARLYGFGRRAAVRRAQEVLAQVGIADAAQAQVGVYSHGMQRRLAIARALLPNPRILLFDEATHDLDPEGAREIRDLVSSMAKEGAAIVWATQRVEELRGFATDVTLLDQGHVAFAGSLDAFAAHSRPRDWVLALRNGHDPDDDFVAELGRAVRSHGTIEPRVNGADQYVLSLREDAVLGDALAALAAAEIQVVACSSAQSEMEDAFLFLTGGSGS